MKKIIGLLAILLLLGGGLFSWYVYESNRDHSAWLTEDGRTYYIDFHGDRVSGWQDIDGRRYCFTEDGFLCVGWHTVDGQRRFFLSDGSLAHGEMTLEGSTYRFDEKGIAYVGWLEESGTRKYFDAEGRMAAAPCTIDGVSYLFLADGTLVTGWYEGRYYLADGTPAGGWMTLEDKACYFLEDGAPAQGWMTLDGETYYFREDGSLTTGWLTLNAQTFYFTQEGHLYHGWLQEGEYSYYFLEDGTMAVGPTQIEGQTRYFTPKGIHLWLVNPWNALPEDYEVELVTLDGGYRVAKDCHEALLAMLEGCREAGLNPYQNSGYRTYWDQLALYQAKIKEYGYALGKQIVAEPNTSEHQLGLAVDIVDGNYRTLNEAQGTKPVQLWLMEHCWDYGFILRYPEGTTEITGIIYEPWHYRYVGLEVAQELKELGITLEEYLGAVQPE